MRYKVQTTETQLARGTGIKRYWVKLLKYDGRHFAGFVHISSDLFESRLEALRFGRAEVKKRTQTK